MPFQPFLLLAACLLLLLDPVLSAADEHPKVTFTTNATSVHPGQPFTAQCQVTGYEVQANDYLAFRFYRKSGTIDEHMIEYLYNADSSGERHWSSDFNSSTHHDLAIHLQPNTTFPACKVTMRTTSQSHYEYYCKFTSGGIPWYSSNYVSLF